MTEDRLDVSSNLSPIPPWFESDRLKIKNIGMIADV